MAAPPVAPELTRQRIDYVDRPDGSVTAILTITLPGGVTKRFESHVSKRELEAVAGEIVGAEYALAGDEVGFGFLKKIVKGVGKIAKSVASSKVFKLAASGLALAAPVLGPLAPVALAASAGMGVASKLSSAAAAAAKGATAVANAFTKSAATDARKLTKTPEGAASLLAAANRKRLGAEAVAAKAKPAPAAVAPFPRFPSSAKKVVPRAAAKAKPKPKPAAPKAAAPAYAPMSDADLLARARAGRVKSNINHPVSDAQLLAAHRSGRIFWVQ